MSNEEMNKLFEAAKEWYEARKGKIDLDRLANAEAALAKAVRECTSS